MKRAHDEYFSFSPASGSAQKLSVTVHDTTADRPKFTHHPQGRDPLFAVLHGDVTIVNIFGSCRPCSLRSPNNASPISEAMVVFPQMVEDQG